MAWRSPYYSPVLTRLDARLASGPAGPIAVVVASMYGDGRVRERAVRATLERPAGELVPLLVLRTADWVTPIRDRARAGLALLLAGDPGGCLPAALPTILAVESRTRAGFARSQALAALLTASVVGNLAPTTRTGGCTCCSSLTARPATGPASARSGWH